MSKKPSIDVRFSMDSGPHRLEELEELQRSIADIVKPVHDEIQLLRVLVEGPTQAGFLDDEPVPSPELDRVYIASVPNWSGATQVDTPAQAVLDLIEAVRMTRSPLSAKPTRAAPIFDKGIPLETLIQQLKKGAPPEAPLV